MTRRGLLAGGAAFAAMEPVAYAAHRWVMHGPGWGLHRSHHDPPAGRLEANDWFPVGFAAATVALLAAASRRSAGRLGVAAGVGVTVYGAAYGVVHDVYVHGRLGALPPVAPLERLRAAHGLHHLDGGEPYGMLLPLLGPGRRRQVPVAAATLRHVGTRARRAKTS